jgi:hypothetical protein
MKEIVAGVFGPDAANVSHEAGVDEEMDGVTCMTAVGALETLTGTCTGAPFTVALMKTTLGLTVSVFCACKVATPASKIAVIADRRGK